MSDEAEVKVDATVADEPADNGPNSIMDPGNDNSDWDLGSEHPEGSGDTAGDGDVKLAPATSLPADVAAKPDDGFPQDLLDYAETFGFKREDFASPGELAKSIQMVQRFAQQQPQPNQTGQHGAGAPLRHDAAASVNVKSTDAAVAAQPLQAGQFEFKIPAALLDKERWADPEIAEFAQSVDGLNKHYKSQLERLEQQNNSEVARLSSELRRVQDYHQQQQLERFFDEADALFNADESLADKFGKGGRNDLPADSPALQERRAVLEQMFLAQGMFAQSGKPIPSTDKLYAIAKGIKYSDQTQQIARRQIAEQLRDSKGRFSAPPAHRPATDLPHGPDRAKQAVAKFLRDTPTFDTEVDTGLAA
jgi:hypothetical protein